MHSTLSFSQKINLNKRSIYLDFAMLKKDWEHIHTYIHTLLRPSFRENLYILCSCVNIKEILAQNRRNIWRVSKCKGIWTHNYLVRKRALILLFPFFWITFEVTRSTDLKNSCFDSSIVYRFKLLKPLSHFYMIHWNYFVVRTLANLLWESDFLLILRYRTF